MSEILGGLNPNQEEAAKHIDGALLLLAGAGSGKTKTLTTRLAYLINEIGIPATSILCLTFTNKAATEMRERAMKLIGPQGGMPPLLCTFHKFGLIFLKKYISFLERQNNFVLIDSDDSKKILKSFGSKISPSILAGYISHCKNQIISPSEAMAKTGYYREVGKVYAQYQEYLEQKNLVDFDDLLYLPFLILQNNFALAQSISKQYEYIMVDEYQDTNHLQYRLLKLLCSAHSNLCVVGDDDQSIYSWRGADIRNILEFEKDFSDAKIIKLEQNYRSTPQILKVANALIAHNHHRLGKVLESMQEEGEEVQVLSSEDSAQEMKRIIDKIKELRANGVEYESIAILYRLNALSRNVEDGLNKAKIPYELIGNVRFYERAEVKDVLSYLRVVVNLDDDFSLLRIVNKPKRGIGKTTQEKFQDAAKEQNLSLYGLFCNKALAIQYLGEKNYEKIAGFFDVIVELKEALELGIEEFISVFEKRIDLVEEFKDEERRDREANILELFASMREFMQHNDLIEDFLNDLTLSSDLDKSIEGAVSCMSIHSSKGLEFDYVFLIGCEEGFFPLVREDGDLEEERRLGYVAFTRAKKLLILSSVAKRSYRGKAEYLPPSRFLKESQVLAQGSSHQIEQSSGYELKKGVEVRHKVFGSGRVLEVSGKGKDCKVKVSFGGNERVIMATFLEY